MKHHSAHQITGTVLGVAAILLWSTTVAVSRSVTEVLGAIPTAAAVFLWGGLWGVGFFAIRPKAFRNTLRLPVKYLFGCGALFVAYMGLLYGAIGTASDRATVIEVGVINYLWPSMTILLSIPLLKKRARPTLVPGVLLAVLGMLVVTFNGTESSFASFLAHLSANVIPFVLALGAAVSWGLYSVLSRRWAGSAGGTAVPLFLLATGFVMTLAAGDVPRPAEWSSSVTLRLAYLAILPGFCGYFFWDYAVRRGNIILVATLSYFTPLFSTLICCFYFGIPLTGTLITGCVILVAGALIAKHAVIERTG